jgi:hypothetical protein
VQDEINTLFGVQIKFNQHFNSVLDNLKQSQKDELMVFLTKCKDHEVKHRIVCRSKAYKDCLAYTNEFGSNIRAILIKKKNADFIELFLGLHKYYDDKIRELL